MEDLDHSEFKTEIQFLEEKLKMIKHKFAGILICRYTYMQGFSIFIITKMWGGDYFLNFERMCVYCVYTVHLGNIFFSQK